MTSTLTTLKQARELISDKKCWMKGQSILRISEHEFAYCALGALESVGAIVEAYDLLSAFIPGGPPIRSLVAYNDAPSTTHEDILRVFDRTIAREEAKLAEFDVNPEPEVEEETDVPVSSPVLAKV